MVNIYVPNRGLPGIVCIFFSPNEDILISRLVVFFFSQKKNCKCSLSPSVWQIKALFSYFL